jgi:hypothetical protein
MWRKYLKTIVITNVARLTSCMAGEDVLRKAFITGGSEDDVCC